MNTLEGIIKNGERSNQIPVSEMRIDDIATWCTEKGKEMGGREEAQIQVLVHQLFDAERKKVHDAIRSLGIIICG